MKRMEQGVPLEVLELQTCRAAKLSIQVLAMAVPDVQCPEEEPWSMEDLFSECDDIPDGQCKVCFRKNNDDTPDSTDDM
jgi:hypothetical protein